jgi:hypothetical protein
MKTIVRTVLILTLVTVPAVGLAQEVGQQIGETGYGPMSTGYVDFLAGLAYTDNALLTAGGQRNDGIGTVGFDTDYTHQGTLSINLLGDLERLQYIRNSFSGSFDGNFKGDALWGTPSDPLQWLLSDSFGEGMIDPLAAPTPADLQWVNQVTTGPYLNLNFGPRNRLTFYGLYGRSNYESSPYNAQTYEGGAEISRQLAGSTSVSLQASDARTAYLDRTSLLANPGHGAAYYIKQASIEFQGQYVRTNLTLAAGYNIIDYGDQQHGAPYYKLQLSRSLSPFTTVFIGGQSSYSTFGGSMQSPTALLSAEGGVPQGAGFITSSPFEERMATAGVNFHRVLTTISLSGIYGESLYVEQAQDDNRDATADLTIGQQLRPTVSLQLQVYGTYESYGEYHARTHRVTAVLTLSKQLARTMFGLYVRGTQQSGSPGASGFTAASYHDFEVGAYFTYDLFGERTPGGGGAGLAMGVPGLPGAP